MPIDYDKLDDILGENKKDKVVKEEIPLEDNPFASDFQSLSSIHSWYKTDENGDPVLNKEGKKIFEPQNFGIQIQEVNESKEGNIYLKGMVYYKTYRQKEIIFPFTSMETQLKRIAGVSDDTNATKDNLKSLEGKNIWVRYGGKKDNPTPGRKAFHSCYIEEK